MTRTMYDGIDASRLPTNAQLVGGYVDGNYRWSDADWARFGASTVKVRIAVFSTTNDGIILDVEPGNATPAQSVDWVIMRRDAGVDPTVYMNTSTWDIVRSAFQARGVAEPHYWVAQYDNIATVPSGAVGKQYFNSDSLGYDLSVVADYWPGVDPEGTLILDTDSVNAVRDAVLNKPLGRQGVNESGTTTLGSMAAWNDAHTQQLINALNALQNATTAILTAVQAIKVPVAQVDTQAVAEAVVGLLKGEPFSGTIG